MAKKQQQPQTEGKGKAETKALLIKKLLFAFQTKREGRLTAEDFSLGSTGELMACLDQVSQPELPYPYGFIATARR
jgi:hypothetical protein